MASRSMEEDHVIDIVLAVEPPCQPQDVPQIAFTTFGGSSVGQTRGQVPRPSLVSFDVVVQHCLMTKLMMFGSGKESNQVQQLIV